MAVSYIKKFLEPFYASTSSAHDSIHAKIGLLKTSAKDRAISIKKRLKEDQGIIRFIRENWFMLLAYTIAWSVILTGTGAIYGFKACTIPLSIGLGCGAGFGVITAIVTIVGIDPHNSKNKGRNTLWSLLHKGLTSLDDKGTLPIVTSVAVTVLLAFWVAFPYAAGAGLGVFLGNHLATKLGYNIKKSFSPNSVEGNLDLGSKNMDWRGKFKELETKNKDLEARLEKIEKCFLQQQPEQIT